jgi:short-chain Z-isoprenyl diphosphate synthase
MVRKIPEEVYTRNLLNEAREWNLPKHVGILIDGNRRWARSVGLLDPSEGHRVGGERVREVLGWLDLVGVEQVTIFMLSDDNLRRDRREVDALMEIIINVVAGISGLHDRWRIEIIGALDLLPGQVATKLKEAAAKTADRSGHVQVNIAVGYGGQREIADAVRSAIESHVARGGSLEDLVDHFDIDQISEHVYTAHQPHVDLIIRTSGEQRLSGFLLWQSAYAEFYFCDCYWPDFRLLDLLRALRSYSRRNRRFGR